MHLLAADNKYPDCLLMELEIISNEQQYELYLKIKFNSAWESLGQGRVKFALKRGQLKLTWQDLEMPLIARELGADLEIAQLGSGQTQTWIFTPPHGENLLKNKSVPRVLLATCKIKGDRPRIEAVFSVLPSYLSVIETENLWRHDINPNKYTVLERKLVYFLQEIKIENNLSWLQFGTEETPFKSNYYQPKEESINSEKAARELKELIARVYKIQINDFLELAELVNLNPIADFAGGNFLANNLNNIQLSGANLHRTNFRGAVLTDADLSEANLSYSKLSGADLSGAYLENANLSHANLRSASRAVANLIGADLSYANLTDVNLTNTNFTEAKVSKALFGNNEGLSEQMKVNLISRGAIFDDA